MKKLFLAVFVFSAACATGGVADSGKKPATVDSNGYTISYSMNGDKCMQHKQYKSSTPGLPSGGCSHKEVDISNCR